MDQNNKNQENIKRGTVIESLPNTMFKVELEDTGEQVLMFLSGKMRMHRIRVLVGDKVEAQIDPYSGKGRISRRL